MVSLPLLQSLYLDASLLRPQEAEMPAWQTLQK